MGEGGKCIQTFIFCVSIIGNQFENVSMFGWII